MGYDSNQSLGKKETGAKAALPIWMAVMREAIAGKDDEQFLGDEESPPLHQAAAEIPANPGAGPNRQKSSAGNRLTRQDARSTGTPGSGSSPSGSARHQAAGQAGIARSTRPGQARRPRKARLGY